MKNEECSLNGREKAEDEPSFDAGEILELFQIDQDRVESLDIRHESDGVHIALTLVKEPHECPVCQTVTARVKGYTLKRIRHSVLSNYGCTIDYRARRFVCPCCGKTFYETNPFVYDGMRISAATVYNVLRDLRDPHETFTSVAARYRISTSTAISLFDSHVVVSRKKLPETLCVDEVYAMAPGSPKGGYVCVLLDFRTQKVVDVLPSRKKADLIEYFSMIPRKERENVRMISFDLWKTYREVAHIMLPNAQCSCDRFHILQELSRQVQSVRIRVMKRYASLKSRYEKEQKKRKLAPDEWETYDNARKSYYILKKFSWMLYDPDSSQMDPNRRKKFNRVMGRYMNYYDIHEYLIHIDSDIETAEYLAGEMHDFYGQCTCENAADELRRITMEFRNSGISELTHFAGTLGEWKTEIVNSFVQAEGASGRTRISNGVIENVNKTIKNIKHNANGYRSFSRLRSRIMYCLNDDTAIQYMPEKEVKKK